MKWSNRVVVMVAGWFVQVWVPWRGLRWPVESSQGSMTAVCLLIPEPLSRYSSAVCYGLSWLLLVVVFIDDSVCVLNEGLALVFICILWFFFSHFIGLWSAQTHTCVDECTNTFVCLLFSFLCCAIVVFHAYLYTQSFSAFDFWKV